MIPDLLRDCDVGLLLVRRTPAHLDVLDANRAAVSLLGAPSHDVRGTVRSSVMIGRLPRLAEAVALVSEGRTSRWCTLVELVGGCTRHLDVRVTPYDDGPRPLALVQLSELPSRHETCLPMEAIQ